MIRSRALLLLALPALAALPAARIGYTREDWLLLWRALEPHSAPPGAGGVFARPLGELLWKLAVMLGGDRPRSMHLLAFALALLLALAAVRLAQTAFPGSRRAAWIVSAIVGAHAACWECRLWAAASNGLLAGALAVLGAALLLEALAPAPPPHARARLWAGLCCIALAGLARADGWAAGAWGVAALLPQRPRTRGNLGVLGALLLGCGLALWSTARSLPHGLGAPTLARAGALARLMIVPWGAPLPGAVAAVVGGVALVLCAGLLARSWRSSVAPAVRGGLLLIPALLVATTVLPLQPAGRYLVLPVVALALGIAALEQHLRETERGVGLARAAARGALAGAFSTWLLLHLLTPWAGRAVRALNARARAETTLYATLRAARSTLPVSVDSKVVLVDAPPMGWRGAAADAENVASAALRRTVRVELLDSPDQRPAGLPALRWTAQGWIWLPPRSSGPAT